MFQYPLYPLSDRIRCNASRRASPSSAACAFQYPLSDRIRCNSWYSRCSTRPHEVSVSSLGSNSLQRRGGGGSGGRGNWFQYPLSDRIRCNRLQRVGAPCDPMFQYPLSDRIRCNSRAAGAMVPAAASFSILSRIEFAATVRGRNDMVSLPRSFSILSRIEFAATDAKQEVWNIVQVFQYPLSDRIRCN